MNCVNNVPSGFMKTLTMMRLCSFLFAFSQFYLRDLDVKDSWGYSPSLSNALSSWSFLLEVTDIFMVVLFPLALHFGEISLIRVELSWHMMGHTHRNGMWAYDNELPLMLMSFATTLPPYISFQYKKSFNFNIWTDKLVFSHCYYYLSNIAVQNI